jgi:twitching motility protein PilT
VISQRLVPAADGGRVPVCEILRMTGRVRDQILRADDAIDLEVVISDGVQTFDQALDARVTAGRVSVEDALAAATSPDDFRLLLGSAGCRGTTMMDARAA